MTIFNVYIYWENSVIVGIFGNIQIITDGRPSLVGPEGQMLVIIDNHCIFPINIEIANPIIDL